MIASHLAAVREISARAQGARPRIAVVLGSGWGGLAEHVRDPVRVPYADLEGFPLRVIPGHAGELVLGRIGENDVAILSGRKHAYEDGDMNAMRIPLLALKELGCEILVQTNAVGSLDAGLGPGSLLVVRDHINLPQRSPLVGTPGSERFVNMVDAYDPGLRAAAIAVARSRGVDLREGVFLWCFGPQFETPAEIRLFRQLGADVVGMSLVPETILARHAGIKVLALSLVTNMGAGLSAETLSHAHTLEQAGKVGAAASGLLAAIVREMAP